MTFHSMLCLLFYWFRLLLLLSPGHLLNCVQGLPRVFWEYTRHPFLSLRTIFGHRVSSQKTFVADPGRALKREGSAQFQQYD